jgi:hypothetical protein
MMPIAQHATAITMSTNLRAAFAVPPLGRALHTVFLVAAVTHYLYPPDLLTKPSMYDNLRRVATVF